MYNRALTPLPTCGFHGLTPRQSQIAVLVHLGLTDPQIAHGLSIAVTTVRRHIEDISARLNMSGIYHQRVLIGIWVERQAFRRFLLDEPAIATGLNTQLANIETDSPSPARTRPRPGRRVGTAA